MALNFPVSPSINDIYTYNGKSWIWDGQSWKSNDSTDMQENKVDRADNFVVNNTGTDAVGSNHTVVGDYSFAEGYGNYVIGEAGHAEGDAVVSSKFGDVEYKVIAVDDTAKTITILNSYQWINFPPEIGMFITLIQKELLWGDNGQYRQILSDLVITNVTTLQENKFIITINTDATLYDWGEYFVYIYSESMDSEDAGHAEGRENFALGQGSHSEGTGNVSMGTNSHSEGSYNSVYGYDIHAEGKSNVIEGDVGHIEGFSNTAWAGGGHTEGQYNVLSYGYRHYNIISVVNSTKVITVDLTNSSYETESPFAGMYLDFLISTGSSWSYTKNIPVTNVVSLGSNQYALTLSTSTTLYTASIPYYFLYYSNSSSLFNPAHVEGNSNIVVGYNAHAEGNANTARGDNSHAEGSSNRTIGEASHAEGRANLAEGYYSHAEGNDTRAIGFTAHTEGQNTEASADWSHAEGAATIASGDASHAEGYWTVASGANSHAQNNTTIAAGDNQTAIGKYNISNDGETATDYAFIIGNGTASVRSTALGVTWAGEIVSATGKTLSSNDYTNSDKSVISSLDIANPSSYDVIKYDPSESKWKPRPDTYNHEQMVASDTWVIVHNLGKYPSVRIFDGFGQEVIGEIAFNSLLQVTVTFSGSFSGTAYLN